MIKTDLHKKASRKNLPSKSIIWSNTDLRDTPSSINKSETRTLDGEIPDEIISVFRNIKKIGYFEQPLFMEIVKYMETKHVNQGELLFDVGTMKDCLYVIKSGNINVNFVMKDNSELIIREVHEGQSIFSLLLIVETLISKREFNFSLRARAVDDSVVYCFPCLGFRKVFEEKPDSFLRMIQISMIRLQNVTLRSLHDFFGMSTQLLRMSISDNENCNATKATSNQCFPSKKMSLSGLNSTDFNLILESVGLSNETTDVYLTDDQSVRPHSFYKKLQNLTLEEAELFKKGVEDVCSFFKSQEIKEELLNNGSFISVLQNTYIITQNENASYFYYVISGCLQVTLTDGRSKSETVVGFCPQSSFAGILSVLSGIPSSFNLKSSTKVVLLAISKRLFYSIVRIYPYIVSYLANIVINRLSSFLRNVDFAIDWNNYETGQIIYQQDSKPDKIYIILTGRLRSMVTSQGKSSLRAEYGRGDVVGLVEVLEDLDHMSSVISIRDTELIEFPTPLLLMIQSFDPKVVAKIAGILSSNIMKSHKIEKDYFENSSFASVALIPISKTVPLENFAFELCQSLNSIGPTSTIDSSMFGGKSNEQHINIYESSYLAQLESTNRMLLYLSNFTFTEWTKRCIKRADLILFVGVSDDSPALSELEKEINKMSSIQTQKRLVILHRRDTYHAQISATSLWLEQRHYIIHHYHVRCHPRIFRKHNLAKLYAHHQNLYDPPPKVSDISRLARILTNNFIGLALGGGGARGLSHIGIIKALEEADIPIDAICGTSIGSFIGGLYAENQDSTVIVRKSKKFCQILGGYTKQIIDITLPIVAILTGGRFNWVLKTIFGDKRIESFILPYFCVTTDITSCKSRIHTRGVAWKYIRGSMTLANYLPPICDPEDGHLLLDGGYVSILPATTMLSQGASVVIAVDVCGIESSSYSNFGESLSGWRVLFSKLNPFSTTVSVPSIPEIQARLTYLSSVKQLESVKKLNEIIYIRPPIDKYGTFDFSKYDEIIDVGYKYMTSILRGEQNLPNSDNVKFTNLLFKILNPTFHSHTIDIKPRNILDLSKCVFKTKVLAFSDGEDDFVERQIDEIFIPDSLTNLSLTDIENGYVSETDHLTVNFKYQDTNKI